MNAGGFFGFLALSSVLAANVAAQWPLMDTVFIRCYARANNSHKDFSLSNAKDIVPLLDKNQTTVIYIHGYLESVDMDNVKKVTKALLNYTSDNVCSLDYRQIALVYPVSVAYVPQIGAALAAAINDMAKAGLNATAVHLIGLSLGGQICGYTGRNTAEKVEKIIGLDPAGPLFDTNYLTKNDGLFVSIIHSDMGGYGIGRTSGHVDCKPNLGRRIQPGCVVDVFSTALPPDVCSHLRSFEFFVESISNPQAFPSVQCNTEFDFINGTCDTSSTIPMGYYIPNTASGVYYCQTNRQSPYSKGMPGTKFDFRNSPLTTFN